jgi:hypothetical protein
MFAKEGHNVKTLVIVESWSTIDIDSAPGLSRYKTWFYDVTRFGCQA